MDKTTALSVRSKVMVVDQAILGLIDEFLADLKAQVKSDQMADTSRVTYENGIARFVDFATSYHAGGNVVKAWIAQLHEQGLASGTINTWLSGVRQFYVWAERERGLVPNPTLGIKGARRSNSKTKHKRDRLTDAEIVRVLDIDVSTDVGKRDRAYLVLRAYTGARDVELHRADLADVRTRGNRTVLYIQGKGHSDVDDFVVLVPEAEAALRDWLVVRGAVPGPLFTSFSNRSKSERLSLRAIRWLVKRAYAAAGIHEANKTSHSLRHSAITNAIEHGAPIQKAQSMARHKNIETTAIYFHEQDRLEHPAEEFIDYGKGKC